MQIQIDPQPLIDSIAWGINWGLSLAWTVIDALVFIELENPLGEVVIFVTVLSALLGGTAYELKWIKDNL